MEDKFLLSGWNNATYNTKDNVDDKEDKPIVYLSQYEFNLRDDDIIEYLYKVPWNLFYFDYEVYQFLHNSVSFKKENDYRRFPNEEYIHNQIDQAKLLIVILSKELLSGESIAFHFEVEYAYKKGIPILPLARKSDGVELLFNSMFPNIEIIYTDINDEFKTGNRLKHYYEYFIREHFNKGETTKIRESFISHAFLSYRKLDHDYAIKLLELFASDKELIPYSIWFDEYLTPGEGYTSEIDDAIKASDFVIFLITPKVFEEGNYVKDIEFPLTVSLNKKMIAIEVEPVDHFKLQRVFKGMPTPISFNNKEECLKIVKEYFDIKHQKPLTPEQYYYMAIAYQKGIDSIKNFGIYCQYFDMAKQGGYLPKIKPITLSEKQKLDLLLSKYYSNIYELDKEQISKDIKENNKQIIKAHLHLILAFYYLNRYEFRNAEEGIKEAKSLILNNDDELTYIVIELLESLIKIRKEQYQEAYIELTKFEERIRNFNKQIAFNKEKEIKDYLLNIYQIEYGELLIKLHKYEEMTITLSGESKSNIYSDKINVLRMIYLNKCGLRCKTNNFLLSLDNKLISKMALNIDNFIVDNALIYARISEVFYEHRNDTLMMDYLHVWPFKINELESKLEKAIPLLVKENIDNTFRKQESLEALFSILKFYHSLVLFYNFYDDKTDNFDASQSRIALTAKIGEYLLEKIEKDNNISVNINPHELKEIIYDCYRIFNEEKGMVKYINDPYHVSKEVAYLHQEALDKIFGSSFDMDRVKNIIETSRNRKVKLLLSLDLARYYFKANKDDEFNQIKQQIRDYLNKIEDELIKYEAQYYLIYLDRLSEIYIDKNVDTHFEDFKYEDIKYKIPSILNVYYMTRLEEGLYYQRQKDYQKQRAILEEMILNMDCPTFIKFLTYQQYCSSIYFDANFSKGEIDKFNAILETFIPSLVNLTANNENYEDYRYSLIASQMLLFSKVNNESIYFTNPYQYKKMIKNGPYLQNINEIIESFELLINKGKWKPLAGSFRLNYLANYVSTLNDLEILSDKEFGEYALSIGRLMLSYESSLSKYLLKRAYYWIKIGFEFIDDKGEEYQKYKKLYEETNQ